MRLPSLHKFNSTFQHCKAAFQAACVGPSRADYATRLEASLQRAQSQFSRDYNNRLLAGGSTTP